VSALSESEISTALATAGFVLAEHALSLPDLAAFCADRDVRVEFVADAALALACARGNATALQSFERRYAGEFAGALSRLRLDRASIDEISQRVREKLFVGAPDRPPRILDYSGRGALVGWLRAVIVRAALDWRRHEALEPRVTDDGEPLLNVTGPVADPELENIRARYAAEFRSALKDAIRALSQDERNALRLHVAEGLSLDEVGKIYGVHRATIARWIQSARERLLRETRRLLAERLRLAPNEFESLLRLCRSRLDFSLTDTGV
jgi:RNA polymerase sigma-70 factor (ECF subfamily)